MDTKIYIEETHNPLLPALKGFIADEGYILEKKMGIAEIIISFAYHNEREIIQMDTMCDILLNHPGKKIIFLSWFHIVNNYDKYSSLFSPEKPSCVLMDSNQYRILQLPVSKKDLVNSISELAKISQHEQTITN